MDPLKNSNMRNITSVSNCNGCSVEEKRGKMPAGSELTSMARENDQYTSSGSHEECNQNIATTSVPATDLNDHPSSSSSSSSSSLHNKEYLKLLYKEAHGYNPSATTTTTTCQKSENYLDWDDYFISMAFLSALRSKDPHCQVGACIVNNDHRIIGIGYNGFPRDCADDIMPWNDIVENDNEQPASIDDKSKKKNDDFADGEVLAWLHTKHPYECHAEMNAILNKCSADVFNATMYVADFPCHECAKIIIQSGIKKVVYLNNTKPDALSNRASRILFHSAQVELQQHVTKHRRVMIDFRPQTDDQYPIEEVVPCVAANVFTDEGTINALSERQSRARSILMKEANFDPENSNNVKMRSGNLSWDDYFMAVAFLSAQRSKDPSTQVGACIVNRDRRIVAVGYNGFPRGCSDDVLPWSRDTKTLPPLHTKYPYVCHAETNAILNKCSANLKDTTLYVALFPCNDCAKLIIQAGVRKVVYMSNKYHDSDACRASRIMFNMSGVETQQYVPWRREIVLDLAPPK